MTEDVVKDVDRSRINQLVSHRCVVLLSRCLPRLGDLQRDTDEFDGHDHLDGVGVRRRGRQPHVAARAEEDQVGELREETEGVEAGRGCDGVQ